MEAKQKSSSDILRELELLTHTPGYIHIIAEIASRDLFFGKKEAATVNWRERISYQELSLLIGLMLKTEPMVYEEPPKDDEEALISETRSLLKALHWSYNDQFIQVMSSMATAEGGIEAMQSLTDKERDDHFKQLFGSGASMIEAIFYSDSGCYDFQYFEMAPRLYQFDLEWLAHAGLDFDKARKIYEAIKGWSERVHFGKSKPGFFGKLSASQMPRTIDEFIFSKELLLVACHAAGNNDITAEDIEGFMGLFSSKPGDQYQDFSGPGELNIVNIKPIVEIGDDAYFIPVNFNLAEAVYQSPAYWMRQDTTYLETAAKNRGAANEKITYEYFKGIFGEHAYKSLKVMHGKKTLTDIDVMGVIGSVAVVVQNKGKKMTLEALKGNEEVLKSDFKQAIQSAYNQGIQSRDILLGSTPYKLIDENGEEVILPQGIEEVYILCVTADVYPASLHQLNVYLEKRDDQPWPIPLSLFDLDLLAMYLPDPYDFTFYIRQRINLTGVAEASGEMALLGFHIGHGLFKPDKADKFLVDQDFAQLIDADYMYRKGRIPKPARKDSLAPKWSNKQYDQIIDELKTNITDPKLTDIIFYLKTIPPNIIDGITEAILRTRAKAKADRLPHNFSMPIDEDGAAWGGFSYIMGHSIEEIRDKLAYIVKINKYKHKAPIWLGLGALIDEPNLTNAVLYGWEPWEASADMDVLVKQHDARATGYELSLQAIRKERRTINNALRPPKKAHDAKNKRKASKKARKRSRRLNRRR